MAQAARVVVGTVFVENLSWIPNHPGLSSLELHVIPALGRSVALGVQRQHTYI